ncbi:MarR family transcriptional regulator [Microbacterium sp. cx-55]|uniref:MarR family winged helix-turn-helix transcriptional regulator n=1 Tax=unclassified Microbacterium TaxID=2609290 RepID=UPI001CBFE0BA|nr:MULTISPECIES: MarR family transcriptional regulator [unclassified Microbacterium]MBZ4487780.1 MarR family transcriptional regulator [Microbacterium sp. cx-55]MCC4909194.1 MarR family transcriptional regulator [Microbacterium sp. cx-59]UGB34808.1 MarR family transcriptional regulator [Microbacterium sp. cx-55]
MAEIDARTRASQAMERLRLAEASLSRRRQTQCGPSENARAAMRLILERADAGESVTPRAISAHLGVSPAAVTGILDKLHAGGMISFAQNPEDRRSKLVVPFDRSVDADDLDPLTARVREMASDLDPKVATAVAEFLEQIVDSVDLECR